MGGGLALSLTCSVTSRFHVPGGDEDHAKAHSVPRTVAATRDEVAISQEIELARVPQERQARQIKIEAATYSAPLIVNMAA
jgi:hypothetical protein